MLSLELTPHAASLATTPLSLMVKVDRPLPGMFEATYQLRGDLAGLILPDYGPQRGTRADELWRSTCFEAFVQAEGEAAYHEFNFSPDERWAAYAFDGYRTGMRAAELKTPWMWVTVQGEVYEFKAHFDAPSALAAASVWRVGLSAVIEEVGGVKSYWALKHPAVEPDFHHADSFVLAVAAT